jgi:hypothetical protein
VELRKSRTWLLRCLDAARIGQRTTLSPTPDPTCPNEMWTPEIVDVRFTSVLLQLFEDNALSDSFTFTF